MIVPNNHAFAQYSQHGAEVTILRWLDSFQTVTKLRERVPTEPEKGIREMILPTKHISVQYSLLGAGAAILSQLDSPQTITALWERARTEPELGVYWRFVLSLDFLFAIRAVDLKDGLIVRLQA